MRVSFDDQIDLLVQEEIEERRPEFAAVLAGGDAVLVRDDDDPGNRLRPRLVDRPLDERVVGIARDASPLPLVVDQPDQAAPRQDETGERRGLRVVEEVFLPVRAGERGREGVGTVLDELVDVRGIPVVRGVVHLPDIVVPRQDLGVRERLFQLATPMLFARPAVTQVAHREEMLATPEIAEECSGGRSARPGRR